MGCVGSDGEDELRASPNIKRRFKFPKKFSDDCIAVDYASVPRKLRSAIKKRGHELVSPDLSISKKLNDTNGVELPRKDSMKKLKKQGISGRSVRKLVIGRITKDEEEVAEALYALAGMFPENAKSNKAKLEFEPSKKDSTPFPEAPSKPDSTPFPEAGNSGPAVKALPREEAGNKTTTLSTEVSNSPSNFGCSDEEVFKIQSPDVVALSEKSLRGNLSKDILGQDAKSSLPTVLPGGDLSGTGKEPGLKIPQPELSGKNSDTALGLVAVTGDQHELIYNANKSKSNGSALWPGLSLTEFCDSKIQRPSLQQSSTMLPSIIPVPETENYVTTNTVALHPTMKIDAKKSWKRCCTHVHICHLISDLKKAERADALRMQSNRLNQGSLVTTNNLTERSNGLNRIVATNNAICSAAETNSAEISNAILLHKRLLQDQTQASPISGTYTSPKQNLDFLSVPSGCVTGDTINVAAKTDLGVGTSTQLQIPFLPPNNRATIPFLLPQNFYSSGTSVGYRGATTATAQQIQLSQYLGGKSYTPSPTSVSPLPKQQAWQQQQQNWSNQLAAYHHHKPNHVAASNILNWQNGKQESPSLLHYAESLLPPSRSSLEVLGSGHASQQQLPHIPVSPSLPLSRLQGQHHLLPYSYNQGNAGGPRPENLRSLQLLCNNQL